MDTGNLRKVRQVEEGTERDKWRKKDKMYIELIALEAMKNHKSPQ